MMPIARPLHHAIAALALLNALLVCSSATADDGWYIGIGGGASRLDPDTVGTLDVDDDTGNAATVIIGRDFERSTSVQLQLHSLGTATFTDGREADYYAAGISVLYRLLDSRKRSNTTGGLALYGRFGFGFLERDADVTLDEEQDEDDAPVWFGAGAGLELTLNRTLAVRAEGLYFDTDAAAAYLSVIARFGGSRIARRTPEDPAGRPVSTAVDATPAPTSGSTAPDAPRRSSIDDRDGDGVANSDDVCLRSSPGFPVRSNGCAMFDGVLAGVTFVDGSDELLDGATDRLDTLAELLRRFPESRIELHAHTDTRGTAREQAVLTRARLRTVGTYLVSQGVSANRLVLRSFGGSRPLDDGTIESNNRIEVHENLR